MDRGTPSDVELLDMAREVLAVCSHQSLKDIINDLTITKSSEITINRILDGQFLTEQAPPPIAQVPPAPPAPPVIVPVPENTVVLVSSSEDDDSDSPRTVNKNTLYGTTVSKYTTLRSSSPPTTMVRPNPRKDSNSYLDTHMGVRGDKNSVIDDGVTTLSSAIFPGSRSRSKNKNRDDESEPVIINLNSKTKKLNVESKLVSPMSNDAFSDWDFEGPSSPVATISSRQSSLKSSGAISAPIGTYSGLHGKSTNSDESFLMSSTINESSSSAQNSRSRANFAPSKAISPPAFKTPTFTYSSNSGRPISSDLQSKTAIEVDDDDWDPKSRTATRTNETVLDIGADTEMLDGRSRWESLLDMSLSPPVIPMDESPDSELEDIMKDMPWKSNSSKRTASSQSSSSRSLRKGKRRAAVLSSVDLQDWGDEPGKEGLPSTDELISLEEEIIGRAKRKQKRVKPNAEVGNSSGDSSVTVSDAELRKAEKEAQRQAKIAEKLVKEAEKQAKKAARELELAKKREIKEQELAKKRELREKAKQTKEEEKLAEKMAVREMRINNRLTAKSEASKEMVLCIEESLYRSTTFGQTLQDYLATIECQVDLLSSAGAETSTNMQLHGNHNDSTSSPIPIQNLIFWRRIVSHRYDDDQDMFVPVDPDYDKEIELELFSVIYLEAKEFANMIQLGQLGDTLALVRRDMKLRKNKERLRMSGMSYHGAIPLKDRDQKQRVIFLISGMESYLRNLKKVTTKRFQQAVLATLQQGATENNSLPSFKAAAEEESSVDYDRIEREMLYLQLEQDCCVIQTSDDDESAQVLVTLTEQIGLRPYK
ncbi:putative monocarboxylate transporter mch1 [Mortierella sp. AD011]|nr:putative monocarboxylate transporter mch1 [Mortierella sp. AD010]KAF9386597.1 putative monocarboxylate transporter mch1 [Mortierella sp. AD011]